MQSNDQRVASRRAALVPTWHVDENRLRSAVEVREATDVDDSIRVHRIRMLFERP